MGSSIIAASDANDLASPGLLLMNIDMSHGRGEHESERHSVSTVLETHNKRIKDSLAA